MSFHLRPKFTGLFHDVMVQDSYWIREKAELRLPPLDGIKSVSVIGQLLPPDPADPTSIGDPGLRVCIDGVVLAAPRALRPGPIRIDLALPEKDTTGGYVLSLHLTGVGVSNFLAWLGRITGWSGLQAWRRQARNRRLRIERIEADGEVLFDFSNRATLWNAAFARRFLRLGLNVVGFFRADLGVGESARCMARAAEAASLGAAFVNLKLHCINPQTDDTFGTRLQETNPFPVNVFHLDAPVSSDIDHHHGKNFRAGKYNIGFWAWELPEFPDGWIHHANHFDEIWTPSRFTSEAIAAKLPLPVLTMPHAISFVRPEGDHREKFGLPKDKFLFLFLYDLNSYSERKNPAAVLEAFRRSGQAGRGAGLIIKVHNESANPGDFEKLRAAAAGLPDTILLAHTLKRQETYELEAACDCFVSLHRSEGFGLAVAESMYLGKPVIATDWSGTAEFLTAANGCPVRCSVVTLDRNHGPYAKGQSWAEPDIDHAAWWMQQLMQNRELGRTLGSAARTTIESGFSPAVIGARYRRRLEAIASW